MIPYYSTVKIEYLRVYEKSGYRPNKLYRAETKSGRYIQKL